MNESHLNWAGNYAYGAASVVRPENVEQVRDTIARAKKVRALGTRHSFNGIADTTGVQISSEKLDRILSIDTARMTVTVEGGVKYGRLGTFLHERGFALGNLASLPHISVAGACATGTHGSGDRNGNLATAVVGMEIVTGEGKVVSVSRESHADTFDGMVVNLGAMGFVAALTLRIMPTFQVRQIVYENLPFAEIENHFDEIFSSAFSVSMFTNWQGDSVRQVWRKCLYEADQTPMPRTFFGATLVEVDRHPIAGLSAQNCTVQGGSPGPWHERLPHFRMDYTPSSGEELQSEYFVPRQHAVEALAAVRDLRDQITPHLLVTELRTIAADELWMSPCCKRASLAIHFTWKRDWEAVQKVLPQIEQRLAPFEARPHWGKLFTLTGREMAERYPRIGDFQDLVQTNDPAAKFRNEFLRGYIFGDG
jgi:xylitol oxidase